jgi:hypothetical protein
MLDEFEGMLNKDYFFEDYFLSFIFNLYLNVWFGVLLRRFSDSS